VVSCQCKKNDRNLLLTIVTPRDKTVYLALLETNIGKTLILEALKDCDHGLASCYRDLRDIFRF
jgi:hypothetical protein